MAVLIIRPNHVLSLSFHMLLHICPKVNANEKVETSGTSSNRAATGSIERWKKPRQGWMKVNFDGGLDFHNKCGGLWRCNSGLGRGF